MVASTSTVGPGASLVEAIPVPPSLALLLLLGAVVVALIYAYQPPFPQTAVFAFLPWIVTGSFLNVLASTGPYPPYLEPLFTEPGAYLTVLFIPGLAWTAMLNASVSRRALPAYHHYIGTMGVGAMIILWAVLLFHVESAHLSRMLILIIVPLIGLLATGLISLSIGLWSPDFMEYTAITGGFTVFGALVYGIATVMGVAVNGQEAHTVFSRAVRDAVVTAAPHGVGSVGVTHLWAWLFVLVNLAVGIHVATHLAGFADENPRRVYLILALVGGVVFTLGFNHLLVTVVVG